MPKVPDPISFQAHCDWFVLSDPTDPPSDHSEGRALHCYADPALLAAHPELGFAAGDAERIGSAAWQAAQVAANREDPTMEWALMNRAWDRAQASYEEQPAFLNQLRRHQRACLELIRESGLPLEAPSHPGLGVDTWVLIASNGERGSREMLAPLMQISDALFESLTTLMPTGLLGDFEGEREWAARETGTLATALLEINLKDADPLAALACHMLVQCAISATQHGWLLAAEGPEPQGEWDLGDLEG